MAEIICMVISRSSSWKNEGIIASWALVKDLRWRSQKNGSVCRSMHVFSAAQPGSLLSTARPCMEQGFLSPKVLYMHACVPRLQDLWTQNKHPQYSEKLKKDIKTAKPAHNVPYPGCISCYVRDEC